MNQSQIIKNRYGYGVGTIGRDAVYTLISMFQMFYLTDILKISNRALGILTIFLIFSRIYDGVNDPIMGIIVDNTKSKYGKFKPWMFIGAILSGIFAIVMFTDFTLSETGFIFMFCISYLLFEMAFTANDIAFWSMLPALSQEQEERSRIGAFARICANIGMFAMVVSIIPLTNFMSTRFNISMQKSYFFLTVSAVVVMWIFQAIMLLLVKEQIVVDDTVKEKTKFKDVLTIIFKNDQLVWIGISMTLFMIGYLTTTSFGVYYFKYIYGDENMYSLFTIVLGVSQLSALALSPLMSKRFNRNQLYTISTLLVVAGYVIFFFAPTHTMLFIGIAGVLMFVGQAIIQLLMLMFITDTVEYGEYKFKRRNESVTLALQTFIYKVGSAGASGMVGFILLTSKMREATLASDMTDSGIFIFKMGMMIVPLILIVIGFIIYKRKFIIDEQYFKYLVEQLQKRREEA